MSRRPARRLVEPDFWTCPHGVRARPEKTLTFGPEVAEVNAQAGFAPDPQQELGLDLIFAIRPDGSPASFSFCVICCRQNLKTGLFKQAAIGWLFVLDVPLVVWSAHEMSTTAEAKRELGDLMLGAPTLRKRMMAQKNHGIYDDNGSERIELRSGQRIMFKARTRDGGRGLAAPKLILDEAFALKPSMMGSLLPLMTAQQDPQILYGSSAGKADSAVLFDIRNRGRVGASPEMSYLEWLANREECADPDCQHPKDAPARGVDCALDREHLIRQANPTISTGRITLRTIANLRQELPAEEFMRECLGWWEDPTAEAQPAAVDLVRWDALGDKTIPAPTRAAVVLDVEPDQSQGSIGVAGAAPGGRTLAMVHTQAGIAWMVDRLKKLRQNVDVLEVALHPSTQAAVLATRLDAEDIPYHKLTSQDVSAGCGTFLAGVDEGRVVHLEQLELTGAIAVARTRYLRETQVWDRRDLRIPLTTVVSASTAAHRWAVLTAKPDTPPPSPRPVKRTAGRAVDRLNF